MQTLNLTVPTSWAELSQHQLLHVFTCIAATQAWVNPVSAPHEKLTYGKKSFSDAMESINDFFTLLRPWNLLRGGIVR